MGTRIMQNSRIPLARTAYKRHSDNGLALAYQVGDLFVWGSLPKQMIQETAQLFDASDMTKKLYTAGVDWNQWVEDRARRGMTNITLLFTARIRPEDDTHELAGAAWVEDCRVLSPSQWAAEIAFGVLPGYRQHSFTFGRLGVEWCFREKLGLTSLYSYVVEENKRSTVFCSMLGFRMTEPMPGLSIVEGKPARCRLACLTKRHWQKSSVTKEILEDVAPVVQNRVAGEPNGREKQPTEAT